jgi:uncharacterized membrane-anchored protein YjiN (DUF445 family)
MTMTATAVLIGAGVVFVATRTLEDAVSWLGPVRVDRRSGDRRRSGRLFAVTPLFRDPLGLPNPRTRPSFPATKIASAGPWDPW